MIVVYEYVESPTTGTVHLTTQRPTDPPRTLCGRDIVGWLMGDETLTGLAATCRSCILMVGRP